MERANRRSAVNHILGPRPGLAEEFPWIGAEILRILRDSGAPGCDPHSVNTGLEFVKRQGLTRSRYPYTDLFLE